jgi:hypothetical protein
LTFLADELIGDVEIVHGLEAGLDEKATEVTRQILFLPAVKGGVFVPTCTKVEMTFNLY